jgi:hypothetical protein
LDFYFLDSFRRDLQSKPITEKQLLDAKSAIDTLNGYESALRNAALPNFWSFGKDREEKIAAIEVSLGYPVGQFAFLRNAYPIGMGSYYQPKSTTPVDRDQEIIAQTTMDLNSVLDTKMISLAIKPTNPLTQNTSESADNNPERDENEQELTAFEQELTALHNIQEKLAAIQAERSQEQVPQTKAKASANSSPNQTSSTQVDGGLESLKTSLLKLANGAGEDSRLEALMEIKDAFKQKGVHLKWEEKDMIAHRNPEVSKYLAWNIAEYIERDGYFDMDEELSIERKGTHGFLSRPTDLPDVSNKIEGLDELRSR